jgi:Family of unknown function (DUF5754)
MEARALSLGATSFGKSKAKNKRYYVVYNGKRINFGDPNATTYADGATIQKRDAFRARHSKIKLKNGTLAYKNKNQPAYWAWNLLW